MKLFTGTTNPNFSKKIARHLGLSLGKVNVSKFADGEINIIIEDNVRQEDCYIIQPTCVNYDIGTTVNDSLMELLIMVDALKRGSARKVVAVIPYYGYSRQDRKDYSRAPISAAVVAKCLESANIDRIIVYDLHAGQIAGFFKNTCPVDNLYAEKYFKIYIQTQIASKYNNICIVAPDEGAVKTAFRMSERLNCSTATIFKSRNKPNEVAIMKLMGDVNGKTCIMIDDIIDTAGTICRAANLLKENGSEQIFVFAVHGLFSKDAINKIESSNITSLVVTNTIPHRQKVLDCNKITVIDVSKLCAEAIKRNNIGESLQELYESVDDISEIYGL
jgi:ribose-phosphate pyrophosphokinase